VQPFSSFGDFVNVIPHNADLLVNTIFMRQRITYCVIDLLLNGSSLGITRSLSAITLSTWNIRIIRFVRHLLISGHPGNHRIQSGLSYCLHAVDLQRRATPQHELSAETPSLKEDTRPAPRSHCLTTSRRR